MLSNVRSGRFTSSQIYKLMAKGRGSSPSKVKLTYIKEKGMEARLGRPLNSVSSARPLIWGTTLEKRVNSLLDPFEYQYCSDETIKHPDIDIWAGTPDWLTKESVVDAKCPYTMKSFCEMADIIMDNDVEAFKKLHPDYYWQLVSNAIITDKKKAELIVYCPYKSELKEIQDMVANVDEDKQNELAWIFYAEYEDLPHLIDGGYYKNINKMKFDISEEDKFSLVTAVLESQPSLLELSKGLLK